MRHALTLLSLLTLLVALAAAGSAGANRHAAKATFKFCTDPTFPPMEYTTTSGKIIGFDVDMATKLAATWGGTAVASKTAFPGLIPALNAKRCDAVISGIFVTPDRLKQAAGRASWSAFREQVMHLAWVDSMGDTARWLEGVAETKIACLMWSSNSSKLSGRLSSAEGRRKP